METQGRDLPWSLLAAPPGPDRFIRDRLRFPCPEWGQWVLLCSESLQQSVERGR